MSKRPTILITGGTNGIGRIAALSLAGRGADLIIVARDPGKAEAVRTEISRIAPAARVDLVCADFARLRTVAAAATDIAARHERIDVLVNNAGLHGFEQRVTEDGFAEMVSVNHLAPWLLTAILRPRLIGAAPARIVTVASEASRSADGLDPARDLLATDPFTRRGSSRIYARTKLMNIMFSMELARQLAGTGVSVTCLDPGFNVTGLGRELPLSGVLERLLRLLRIGNPERGAGLIVRHAADPAFAGTSGRYYSVKQAAPLTPVAPGGDAEAQRALWTATEDLLRPFLPQPGA